MNTEPALFFLVGVDRADVEGSKYFHLRERKLEGKTIAETIQSIEHDCAAGLFGLFKAALRPLELRWFPPLAEQIAMLTYRELEVKLVAIREHNEGKESPEEDSLLDEMDDAWWKLTHAQREHLNKE